MTTFLSGISVMFIPAMITTILLYGLYKKAPVYDLFIEGAKDGLASAVDMLPFIIAIFVGIEALTSSGAMAFLQELLAPFFEAVGVPRQLISMILLRPISGNGSLVLAEQVMRESGADSQIGRTACTMVGSCETVFYALALYFGVTSAKNLRHTFAAGMIGYIVGIAASIALCRVM